MTEFLGFIASWLAICFIFAFPGVLFERWLVSKGFAPDRTRPMIFTVVCLVFIKQFWFRDISWSVFTPIILLAMTFGIHRGDFWTIVHRGKWWWKSKGRKTD